MSDTASETAQELARLVKLLVDHPEEVDVIPVALRDEVVLELEVADDDLGQVIGRQGRTARALRSLLAARGERDGERYELEILED